MQPHKNNSSKLVYVIVNGKGCFNLAVVLMGAVLLPFFQVTPVILVVFK